MHLKSYSLNTLFINSGFNRLDNEVFVNRNQGLPSVIKFHPYEPHVAVADKDGVRFVLQNNIDMILLA